LENKNIPAILKRPKNKGQNAISLTKQYYRDILFRSLGPLKIVVGEGLDLVIR